MDEMRDALLKLAYNIRKLREGLMMEDKRAITFGDILDLLDINRDDETTVTVRLGTGDYLTGLACATLWEPHEDRVVENIAVQSNALVVWLVDEEAGDGED